MRTAPAQVRWTSASEMGSAPSICRMPAASTRSTSKAGSGVVGDAACPKRRCASSVAAPVVERDGTEERQARAPGDGALGEQPVGGSEAVVARAQPPLQAAGLEQHGAGEARVPRLGRVAHGLDGGAPAGQRGRDAALQAAGSAGALAAHGLGAVLAQERMQAVDGRLGRAGRLQQSGETGQRRDPVEDAGPLEHLVGEVAVDPVEQGEVEDGFAVRRGEGAPEPGGDPAADGVAHGRGVRGRRFGGDVAPHAQGDGPAAGLGGDLGEAAARQGEAEEAGDVGAGEAQVVRGEDLGVEQRAGGRESGRQRPVGERDVQVRRRQPEQGVEDRDGARVCNLFEFVEREHERRVARLEGAQQHGGSRQRRADRRAMGAELRRQVEAGALEGEGEIRVERWVRRRPRGSARPPADPRRRLRDRRRRGRWSCRSRPARSAP